MPRGACVVLRIHQPFLHLSGESGYPDPRDSERFVDDSVAAEYWIVSTRLSKWVAIRSLGVDSDQVTIFMTGDSTLSIDPLRFLLTQLHREIGNSVRLNFHDAPAAGHRGSAGTCLGGTGFCPPRASPHLSQALPTAHGSVPEHSERYLFREGGPCQLGRVTTSRSNAVSRRFSFPGPLQTLQTAYVRPPSNGFVVSLKLRELKSIAACAGK